MNAVSGVTVQVGGAVAERLLKRGRAMRAVLRGRAEAEAWDRRGCTVALADMTDADALVSHPDDVTASIEQAASGN